MQCVRLRSEAKKAKTVSAQIDKKLGDHEFKVMKTVKLLFLGHHESVEQIIFGLSFLWRDVFKEEKNNFKPVVHFKILQFMKSIVEVMDHVHISYSSPECAKDGKKILQVSCSDANDYTLSPEITDSLKALWADSGVQECYAKCKEYQLNQCAGYFFEDLDRFCDSSYVPSDRDVFRARALTTGITETTFELKNLVFSLIDASKLQTERRKWLHCFQNATAIVYCVALSSYNQFLSKETNLLTDSLIDFKSLCNDQFFPEMPMMVFLDNKNVFAEKLSSCPLTTCFPDYAGSSQFEEAAAYVQLQFENQNEHPDVKKIYYHYVTATDITSTLNLFDFVTGVIIKTNLKACGIL